MKFILSVTLLCAVSTNAQRGRAPPQMRGKRQAGLALQEGPREIHDHHHEHPRSKTSPTPAPVSTGSKGGDVPVIYKYGQTDGTPKHRSKTSPTPAPVSGGSKGGDVPVIYKYGQTDGTPKHGFDEVDTRHHEDHKPRAHETPRACDPATFDAGWGPCWTYHPDENWNYGWCDLDCNECGCASDVCNECSVVPTCADPFDAGFGTCETYDYFTGWNNYYCDLDCDLCGSCASDMCSECDVSTTSAPTPDFGPTCPDPFDAGYGTCETYDYWTGWNNYYCYLDCDDCGNCASDMCSECDVSTTTAPTPGPTYYFGVTCPDPFDAGYGTCETYDYLTGFNYGWCESDCDFCGNCASDMCSECDVSSTSVPTSSDTSPLVAMCTSESHLCLSTFWSTYGYDDDFYNLETYYPDDPIPCSCCDNGDCGECTFAYYEEVELTQENMWDWAVQTCS